MKYWIGNIFMIGTSLVLSNNFIVEFLPHIFGPLFLIHKKTTNRVWRVKFTIQRITILETFIETELFNFLRKKSLFEFYWEAYHELLRLTFNFISVKFKVSKLKEVVYQSNFEIKMTFKE